MKELDAGEKRRIIKELQADDDSTLVDIEGAEHFLNKNGVLGLTFAAVGKKSRGYATERWMAQGGLNTEEPLELGNEGKQITPKSLISKQVATKQPMIAIPNEEEVK